MANNEPRTETRCETTGVARGLGESASALATALHTSREAVGILRRGRLRPRFSYEVAAGLRFALNLNFPAPP